MWAKPSAESRAAARIARTVLDQTDFGDVVGIEILDLRRQLGNGEVPPSPAAGHPAWSYDDEIDAFYVHVAEGDSKIQRATVGRAALSGTGELVSLEVAIAPTD